MWGRPSPGRAEMPFLDHLEELRARLIWSLLAVGIGAVVGFALVNRFDLLGLLIRPIDAYLPSGKLLFLSPTEPFFITLKLGVAVGVLLASPFVAHQFWAFVSPALHPHERRAIVPIFALGLVLFLGGVALAYFVTLPITVQFMMSFQVESLEPSLVIGEYLSFAVKLLLAFGLVFELPVVLLLLAAVGLVNSKMLTEKRRYAIVFMVIGASLITPADVASTLILMGPMLLLYELGIGLVRMVERRRAKREVESDRYWVSAT